MKYWKWMGIIGVFAIALLGIADAWADDKAQCEKLYQAKQYSKALPVCRKAAEQGDASAQFNMGVMYGNGQGVRQDDAEVVKWFRKAAEQGNADAQFNLGYLYNNGQGVRQNYSEAMTWYRKAAEQGDAGAQFNLGGMYRTGQGVRQDNAKAMTWYRKAAEQGHASAQYNLGLMFRAGQGVRQDDAKAMMWYRKAAEQGHASAQYNLGGMYAKGQGVMQSGSAAADWFYKAGLSYLKTGSKEEALQSVERIKGLSNELHLTVTNAFLADKLMARIYAGNGTAQSSPKPKKAKAESVVSGTGWPIAGGYVVTNHHVITGRKNIFILTRNGEKIKATVAMDDATNDLVLLKPENIKALPSSLPLAGNSAQVGERVFTVGYPHPDMMGVEPKLTQGIINSRTGMMNDPRTYQISVPLQAGNSGGPLINMRGEVVGIVTAKLSAAKVFKWTGDLPQNVNYAVKAGYIRMLISSVNSIDRGSELPSKKGKLTELAKRIEGSVLMIIAK